MDDQMFDQLVLPGIEIPNAVFVVNTYDELALADGPSSGDLFADLN